MIETTEEHSQYSSVGVPRRLKGCQQNRAIHVVRSLVEKIVTSVQKGDNNKQTQYPQSMSGQRRKLSLLKIMQHKGLLDVHCCSLFIVSRSSFSLDFLAGYTVSGCYEVTMFK